MKAYVILLVLSTCPQAYCADWIKLSTGNFEFITSGTEREAREALAIFEQARDFFKRANPVEVKDGLPLTLVKFGTAAEYRPYQIKALTPAYFTSDGQRDYIVMSDVEDQLSRVAVHEYTHILFRNSGLNVPVWLNEGMADVYSTLQVRNGEVVVGATVKDRAYSLVNDRWMFLPELLAVEQGSPTYNESARIGIFYAQSWLLAHMLMLGDGYRDKFQQFLKKLSDSGSAQEAFSEVYGKSVADIQAALNTYFRGTSLGAKAYKTTLQTGSVAAAQPVSAQQVEFTLAKISGAIGRFEDATVRLQKFAGASPNNPEIDEARAYLALRSGDMNSARRHFDAALEHGSKDPKTLELAELLRQPGVTARQVQQQEAKALPPEPEDIPPPKPVLKRAAKGK